MADHHEDNHEKEGHAEGHGGGHGGGGHGGGHAGGHGGEHEEGLPEWVMSFADNVALLMGFFVILLAMNMKEPTSGGIGGKEKNPAQPDSDVIDAIISIRESFNSPIDMNSNNPDEMVLATRKRERSGQAQRPDPNAPGEDEQVQSVRPGDFHTIGGVVPFDQGDAQLTDAARRSIADIAVAIRGKRSVLEIRGHTSAAEAFQQPDRALELSFERAKLVASVLAEHGVSRAQMRVIAMSDNDRVRAVATTRSDHAANQRVEVIITNENLPEDPYARDPAAETRRQE